MNERTLETLLNGPLNLDHQGIGLRNTDRRLKQLYGQGLRIHSLPGKGTEVSFILERIEQQ
jgi:two-component system sensor histidine kinase ChiS